MVLPSDTITTVTVFVYGQYDGTHIICFHDQFMAFILKNCKMLTDIIVHPYSQNALFRLKATSPSPL